MMRALSIWVTLGLAASTAGAPPEAAPAEVAQPDPYVMALALSATSCADAKGLLHRPELVTIIDYSRPSTDVRLWVLDRHTRRVLYRERVTHGQGTGAQFAKHFSNRPGSHQSSLGLFVTAEPYRGRNGYSLRLDGLEAGVNHRARERAIVIHGAPYATAAFASEHGRLGRSHGCPAVRPGVAQELIDEIQGGSAVFAYYPDASWLESSAFLHGCSAPTTAEASE